MSSTVYVAVGIGVGSVLVCGIAAIIVKIILKTREHNRNARLLEQGQINTSPAATRHSSDIRRTLSLGRRTSAQLRGDGAPWNPLASTETLEQPQNVKKKLPSIRLKGRGRKQEIPMKQIKHLSAIVESPRSRAALSPQLPDVKEPEIQIGHDSWPVVAGRHRNTAGATVWTVKPDDIAQLASIPDKLDGFSAMKVDVFFDPDRPKVPRSVSMGALLGPQPLLAHTPSVHRFRAHTRSASLGSKPPDQLPPDPLPGLPVISPHTTRQEQMRPPSLTSSISSQGSASSSVLITSPSFRRHADPNQTPKPGMRPALPESRLVDPDKQVSLKSKDAPQDISGEGSSSVPTSDGKRELASIDSTSSLDQYSHSFRSSSVSGRRTKRARLSPAIAVAAQRDSMRRPSAFGVSANGSPTERKRSGVLQSISGNASRQYDGQNSPTSSEGNPFQWDTIPIHKPSALKGSPNARKGHRRQNCVRISTLTPQVLGPPPSRPSSPSITHRIAEEGTDSRPRNGDLPFVSNRRPSRPTSSLGLGTSLRVQTLRASLTPGSPTASLWAAFHESELASQPSDSHLTTSSASITRPLSGVSSDLSIPNFPSPSRVTMTAVQHAQPVPEFCVSRPSFEPSSPPSPLDPFTVSDGNLSSSPPSPISSSALYDPAWLPYDLQASTTSGASLRETSPPIPRPSPLFSEKLTSSNASAIMAKLPSGAFSGAPLLRPTTEDTLAPSLPRDFEFPSKQDRETTPTKPATSCQSYMNLVAEHPLQTSPSGPRNEPPKSVLKNAMALRRMNSEIDTTACRESRRYVQLGREASPSLPFCPSPNPSESNLFDFGFGSPVMDRLTVSKLTPLAPIGSELKRGNSQTYPRSILKVRHDRPESWDRSPLADKISTPLHGSGLGTPNSLYDADGFLRSEMQ